MYRICSPNGLDPSLCLLHSWAVPITSNTTYFQALCASKELTHFLEGQNDVSIHFYIEAGVQKLMKRIFKIKITMTLYIVFWVKYPFNCASGVEHHRPQMQPQGCSQWVDSNGLLVLKSPPQKIIGLTQASLWCGILSCLELEIQHGPFVLPNVSYWMWTQKIP
jgi:hypothetical protein